MSEQVSFESGFEEWQRVYGAEVRGEGVPELGSRTAEGSMTHGDEAGRRYRELESGRGAK